MELIQLASSIVFLISACVFLAGSVIGLVREWRKK